MSSFAEYTRKKKKQARENGSFAEYTMSMLGNGASFDDIAPVRTNPIRSGDIFTRSYQESMRMDSKLEEKKNDEDKRKWFDKGAFDDGYQFGDVTKTILGSTADLLENASTGILGMGEKAVDTLAYLAPAFATTQQAQNSVAYEFDIDEYQDMQKTSSDIIKKDLYDEEKIAKTIITEPVKKIGIDAEKQSVFGEKSDSLVQSAGQLVGTAGLQAVGVPWWVTTGATSFGGEAENALNQGATYEQAGGSALISAGAEILTEKLSGGIKFGGKTLDDVMLKPLTEKIANKAVKSLANVGIDAIGEGTEEVVSSVISNLGTALYKEESIEELLTSEEALDEYIESFIGGAVLGGGMGSINAIRSEIASENTLTENEQKVVDAELENRIKEAESDGKKLSNAEKTKLEEQVKSDLQKGYISTDTIESVLGGETYNTYNSLVEQENTLKKEIERLENMPKEQITVKQGERLTQAREELNNLLEKAEKDSAKKTMTDEVNSIIQNDTFLKESYNEKARKGNKFEADLSKYDAKQREVIKKAVDSGILNNTNKTHEFVDMVAKISADKGVLFDFTNNQALKESGFAIEGKTVNGYVKDGNIALNIDSNKALNTVVGHEITHILEGSDLYAELQNVVKEYATTKGEYDSRLQAIKQLYKGVENVNIDNELTADLIGDYLFTDSGFINSLSTQKPNIFKKIYDEIKYLYKLATAGSKEARELEKVKRAFDKAYKETVKNTSSKAEYDIRKDVDGNLFVDVTEDILDNNSGESTARIIQKVIAEKFNNLIDANGQKIQINKTTNDEFRRSNSANALMESEQTYNDKLRTIANADEILTVAKNWIGEQTKHIRKDDIVEFARGNVAYRVGENGYVADVIVATRKNGSAVLYDIVNIYDKKIAEAPVTMVSNNNSQRRQESSAESNVTDYSQSVNAKYSMSEDSEGNYVSPAVQKRFENSKAVDENGSLKVLYHGTPSGEFTIFDKSKGSVEGDFGSGFYFTDNEADVETNYEGGGPDFENKVARRAEQIEAEEDIDYDEAEQRAREELYKGSNKFEVYLNIENPAIVGKTILLDYESLDPGYDQDDFDSEDEYYEQIEQDIAETIDALVWEVGQNVDLYSADGIADVLFNAYYEGGIGIEDLKTRINELYLEDNEGNLAGNEVTRQIIESLGHDGIIDSTVSSKFKNMGIEEGTTHYIVFKPNQIKSITNQNPTDNPDINLSLSDKKQNIAPTGNYNVYGKDIGLEASAVHFREVTKKVEDIAPTKDIEVSEGTQRRIDLETGEIVDEAETPERKTHGEIQRAYVDNIKQKFTEAGMDFDKVLEKAIDKSTFASVDNTPQRYIEKTLGYKEGQILNDLTINQEALNESKAIKWLNSFTDRKSGELAKLSKKYGIKPNSKEDASAQMYAEGFYINDNNEFIRYGDAELAKDFPNVETQRRIKALVNNPRIREIYDNTLKEINESRVRNGYPEIPRRDNYYLHFRAMDDTFSRLGIPFNPNDIKAKDLPTDINGMTADLKPGQPYFASANQRKGLRTSHSLLGGMERYLTSAKNQIYHIDDIQTLRGLRNYVADMYGQAHGLENLDTLTEEEAEARVKEVYDAHLSTFAKFLNEQANVLAGKTSLIDRGLEGVIGRRGIQTLNTINTQVGKNMVGFNVSSSLTNLVGAVQGFAKANKYDAVKAFTQVASNRMKSIFGKSDGFAENDPTMIRRRGAEKFYRTPYEAVSDLGYFLMSGVDNLSTEFIIRAKYNELTRKGMDSDKAQIEAGKWAMRILGDRSLGQQPQLYNSKMLGLVTKFQLEVRNQLDSMVYDTIQDAKLSNEDINNRLEKNSRTAVKVASTMAQLAVFQHLFGKAFESVAGYNPTFDIISTLMTLFGFDDEEEKEEGFLDNAQQALLELLEDLPYTSTFTGGRIPIQSALPIKQVLTGKDDYGNEKPLLETLSETAPYYIMPGGYNQIKKTTQGLDMFSDEHPVAGSYTASGNLRFPVEDTPLNRVQAGLFGQWASENARDYFDNERNPLKEKQIEEFAKLDIPIKDYWKYREGLSELDKLEDKFDYVAGLDLPVEKKNIMINNIVDRKEDVDLTNYDDFSDYEEFDFATKNPEKYEFLQSINVSYEDYNKSDDAKEAYDWAYKNPEKYYVSKAVASDVVTYREYAKTLNNITADKDENGKSISGSRKEKVLSYVNGLDADYGEKIILFKSEYPADDTYNTDIIEYLNNREDISYSEMESILKELGFTVETDGTVSW